MQRYINTVTDRQGNALYGASVAVRDAAGDLAVIYSDDGVTTKANPTTTDENGEFSFYAANGVYSLMISHSGIIGRTVSGILLEDASSGFAIRVGGVVSAADPQFAGGVGYGRTAAENKTAIQAAIDSLKGRGGTVTIPAPQAPFAAAAFMPMDTK